jgi:hypothetical protein
VASESVSLSLRPGAASLQILESVYTLVSSLGRWANEGSCGDSEIAGVHWHTLLSPSFLEDW